MVVVRQYDGHFIPCIRTRYHWAVVVASVTQSFGAGSLSKSLAELLVQHNVNSIGIIISFTFSEEAAKSDKSVKLCSAS